MKELSLSLRLSGVPALSEEREARDCPMGTLRALRSLTYATESSARVNEHGRETVQKDAFYQRRQVRGRNRETNKQIDKQRELFEPVDARVRRVDAVS